MWCLRGMNNRTDRGFLVLADVSGFTAFVTTTDFTTGVASAAKRATRRATSRMRSGLPMEVPPYFWTIS